MSELVFVKYCSLCGAENARQQPFCLQCLDGDLSTVPVEPRRKEYHPSAAPPPSTPPPAPAACAASIAGPVAEAAPAPPAEEPQTRQVELLATVTLELVDEPQVRFRVKEGQAVGRTAKAEVVLADVPKLDWISSRHARFFRRGEQWYVQHIGGTNFIKVDGELFKGQEEVALFDGSILVLSLTPFRVRLGGTK
jgi:hypothetical protein